MIVSLKSANIQNTALFNRQ